MKFLYVLIISAIPLIEQRGSIPVGIFMNLNPWLVFLCAYIGSLLPIPFVFYCFQSILNFLRKRQLLPWLINIIDNKINKNIAKFEKSKEAILITFIGIPLPTTGVWTGTAIATVLNFNFKKTVLCASIGALISAIVITLICVLIPELASAIF